MLRNCLRIVRVEQSKMMERQPEIDSIAHDGREDTPAASKHREPVIADVSSLAAMLRGEGCA